jgi:two-component system, chemotaxis family, chemotaxis protein CheY
MHILIVDDSRTFRYLLLQYLKELGYESVTAATCAAEAKKLLAEQKFDLVLADWHMPGETGLDLLKHIRATPAISQLPFVMTTMEQEKAHILEALKLGIQSFLFKPLQKSILAQKLNEIAAIYHLQAPAR